MTGPLEQLANKSNKQYLLAHFFRHLGFTGTSVPAQSYFSPCGLSTANLLQFFQGANLASVLVVQVQDFVVFRGQDHGIRECSKDFLAYPKFLLGIFILELKDLTKKIDN